jgi:hypothetical protein
VKRAPLLCACSPSCASGSRSPPRAISVEHPDRRRALERQAAEGVRTACSIKSP